MLDCFRQTRVLPSEKHDCSYPGLGLTIQCRTIVPIVFRAIETIALFKTLNLVFSKALVRNELLLESFKKVVAVVRARGCFGVILDREGG